MSNFGKLFNSGMFRENIPSFRCHRHRLLNTNDKRPDFFCVYGHTGRSHKAHGPDGVVAPKNSDPRNFQDPKQNVQQNAPTNKQTQVCFAFTIDKPIRKLSLKKPPQNTSPCERFVVSASKFPSIEVTWRRQDSEEKSTCMIFCILKPLHT